MMSIPFCQVTKSLFFNLPPQVPHSNSEKYFFFLFAPSLFLFFLPTQKNKSISALCVKKYGRYGVDDGFLSFLSISFCFFFQQISLLGNRENVKYQISPIASCSGKLTFSDTYDIILKNQYPFFWLARINRQLHTVRENHIKLKYQRRCSLC